MTATQDGPAPAAETMLDTPRRCSATLGPGTQNGPPKHPGFGSRKGPTLLTDFLLGRPSPQRLAAQRARRREAQAVQEQVRAAMKNEIKENAVRKVPPPNGVAARVNLWQKRNADALVACGGNPDVAPSEPSEIVVNVVDGSVTEEDRLRIKFRKQPPKEPSGPRNKSASQEKVDRENMATVETDDAEKPGGEETPRKAKPTPKKRIVSDDHWMNMTRKSKSPPRMVGARFPAAKIPPKQDSGPKPIPRDFLKTAKNPTVSEKIQDWAMGVEPPDPKPKRRVYRVRVVSGRVEDSGYGKEHEGESEEESEDDMASQATEKTAKSEKPIRTEMTAEPVEQADGASARSSGPRSDDDGIRVRPLKPISLDDDGIRVKPIRGLQNEDDGIRVTPATSNADDAAGAKATTSGATIKDDDGIRIKPSDPAIEAKDDENRVGPSQPKKTFASSKKTLEDDGIRVRPIRGKRGPGDDDGIRIRPSREVKDSPGRMTSRHTSPERGRSRSVGRTPTTSRVTCPDKVEVSTPKANPKAPEMGDVARKRVSEPEEHKQPSGPKKRREKKLESPRFTKHLGRSDTPINVPPSEAPTLPSQTPSNLNEIPFGQSAFSELDLPQGGQLRTIWRPSKPQAQGNHGFKAAVPKVLKKVVEESKKIIQDAVDPPKPVASQPPSIENWLNKTVDPFMEKLQDGPAQNRTSVGKEWAEGTEVRWRSSSETRCKEQDVAGNPLRKRSVSEHRKPEPCYAPHSSTQRRGDTDTNLRVSVRSRKDFHPVGRLSDHRGAELGPARTPVEQPSKSRPGPARRFFVQGQKRESAPVRVESELYSDLSKSTESIEWTTSIESTEDTRRETEQKGSPKDTAKPSISAEMRRSRAPRPKSLPFRVPAAKKQWMAALKDAFRGESVTKNNIPVNYPSEETRQYEVSYDDEYSDVTESIDLSKPTNPALNGGFLEEPKPTRNREAREHLSEPGKEPEPLGKRRPPTTGFHQLSTILSEGESRPAGMSEMSSYLSETTATQTITTCSTITASTSHSTGIENTTNRPTDVTRKKSHQSSLKRRLTKHSDLVSVLSLPDDPNEPPSRSRSIRSARNVHRSTSKLEKTTLHGLLREFREDENLYSRELKTLVDGVVPVLLNHVVQGNRYGDTDIFEDDVTASKTAAMSKSVVGMGVLLDKIRNAHRMAPIMDARALLVWLDNAYPLYSGYLDVWRLGFQNLIVNLALVAGIPEDEDSLINAMPRNEQGDIVDGDGERVDVAHLLKRPLHRIKMMHRFVKV